MPYRNEQEALEERKQQLEQRISMLEERIRVLENSGDELQAARGELSELLRAMQAPRLEQLQIASPCNESWDAMSGDERVRFCSKCGKNVYDLSMLTRKEAEALVFESEKKVCTRLFRRSDGTVLTADCPVGLRKKRVRLLVLSAAGAAALVGSTAMAMQHFAAEPPSIAEHHAPCAHAATRPEVAPVQPTTVNPPAAPVATPLPEARDPFAHTERRDPARNTQRPPPQRHRPYTVDPAPEVFMGEF